MTKKPSVLNRGVSPTAEILLRLSKDKTAMVGLAIFAVEIFVAVFAWKLMPYDPYFMDFDSVLASPGVAHLFGCDDMGRDILSRVILGTRYSIGLGVCVVLFSLLVGTALGAIVGYFGGTVDLVVMRILDIFQCIPNLLMSIALSMVFGQGFMNTVFALSFGAIVSNTRLLRGSIMSHRSEEYLEAADALNSGKFRTILKHVLPNNFSPLIVKSTMGLGGAIMSASTLSFIGLGIQPPTPEWGAMLSGARNYIRSYPYVAIFPGLAIAITILALNLLGDGIRDAMDPKMRD